MRSERSPFSECATHVVKPNNSCQSLPCHSDGVTHSSMHDYKNLCKTYVLDGTATFPLSLWEREQLCEQVEHTTAGEGATHVVLSNNSCQFSLNYCEVSAHPSSGTMCHLLPHRGEGNGLLKHGGQSDVHEMLKQVQHDMFNFVKRTYSLINLFTYSPRKSAAFTLAEVLITLGIIGVVAAMTMPVLIGNYRKNVVENQLKTVYSLISNAVRMAEIDNGEGFMFAVGEEFDNDKNNNSFEQSEAVFNAYFRRYFKIIKDYPKNNDIFVSRGFTKNSTATDETNYAKCVQLANGIALCFFPKGGNRGQFIVYLNPDKKNKIDGRDVFAFRLSRDRGAFFLSQNLDVSREKLIEGCVSSAPHPISTDLLRPDVCTFLIMQNNFEIPDDYPVSF